jgi:hypothetical protein
MLHPLPFTTFGQIIALGLNAKVYCSHCYEHRSIAVAEMLLRDLLAVVGDQRCADRPAAVVGGGSQRQ